MPDPKLKEAMAEIRGILRKHDIGAYVTLYSQKASEFAVEITPTWSCAYWENRDAGKLRFRAKTSEIGQEKAHKIIEDTCHMIFSMRDLCAKGFIDADHMAKMLQTQVHVDHRLGPLIRHREH